MKQDNKAGIPIVVLVLVLVLCECSSSPTGPGPADLRFLSRYVAAGTTFSDSTGTSIVLPFSFTGSEVLAVYVKSEILPGPSWVLLPIEVPHITTDIRGPSWVSIADSLVTIWNCPGREYRLILIY